MGIVSGTGWKELTDGYSREGENYATNRVSRVYQVPWENRQQFINDVMGFAVNNGGTGSFRPPASDPEFPWLYAKTFRERGLGTASCDGNRTAKYRYANIQVDFEVPQSQPNNPGDATYMEVNTDNGSDVITYDQSYYWNAGPNINEPIDGIKAGKICPVQNITLSIFNWYSAPVGSGIWEDHPGFVNSVTTRILWYTYPPETLMFVGARVKAAFQSFIGITSLNVDLAFKFRNVPNWNQRLDVNGVAREVRIGKTPGNPGPFPTYLFQNLLP